jgi:hypothetical protein
MVGMTVLSWWCFLISSVLALRDVGLGGGGSSSSMSVMSAVVNVGTVTSLLAIAVVISGVIGFGNDTAPDGGSAICMVSTAGGFPIASRMCGSGISLLAHSGHWHLLFVGCLVV